MKNINENTKVTLTLGQLKKLVQEAMSDDVADDATVAKARKYVEAFDSYNPKDPIVGWSDPMSIIGTTTIDDIKDVGKEFPDVFKGVDFDRLSKADLQKYCDIYNDGFDEFNYDNMLNTPENLKKLLRKYGHEIVEVYDYNGDVDIDEEDTTGAVPVKCEKCGKTVKDFSWKFGFIRSQNRDIRVCKDCYDEYFEDGCVDELDLTDSKVNEAEENAVPVKFNKAELLKLGFREFMYKPENHQWADAKDDAVIFYNKYISVCCGNDEGNRLVQVDLNGDIAGIGYTMINPTDENLIELFNSYEPWKLVKDQTKFEL